MKKFTLAAAALMALSISGAASAAVTAEEAAQLGTTLTEFGAEKAGNADGSIPAYTGGLPVDTAPAGWKKGSGRYERGPFDNEKPLFSITPANADKHASKLTPGTLAILKKYSNYRMDVYPSHRSVAHGKHYLSHCKRNALNAKLVNDGNGIEGAMACAPFPIPKSGLEAMWNSQLVNRLGPRTEFLTSTWLIDSSGHLTDVGNVRVDLVHPYLDPSKDKMEGGVWDYRVATWMGPPSQVGTKILQKYPMNYSTSQLLSWIYTQGQRRTRLAPEFAYDTPIAPNGGALNYDEVFGFSGQFDRYDFKLVGKKEIYVPYNAYRDLFGPEKAKAVKNVINPDFVRWELHRVWVVEAALKKGKRHVQPRRTFYIDEDSWAIMATDGYDQAGGLYRIGHFPLIALWDVQTAHSGMVYYDLSKGSYYLSTTFSRPSDFIRVYNDVGSLSKYTAEALAGSGIR